MKLKTILVFAFVAAIMSGCLYTRTDVPLASYAPELLADWDEYQGARLYLMNFDNQADDTSIWYYYSKDSVYQYGSGSTIHNYFWYAVRDGLTAAGIIVSNMDNPDNLAPRLWLTLTSVTDEHFVVRATLQYRGETLLAKPYTVTEPPLKPKTRTPKALERRAYAMTSRLVEEILADPDFKAVVVTKAQQD